MAAQEVMWLAAAAVKTLFFVLTAFIPMLTIRAFRFFEDSKFLIFSAGFSLISVSFLVQAMGSAYQYLLSLRGIHNQIIGHTFQVLGEVAFVAGLIGIIVAYLAITDWWHRWLLVIITLFASTTSIWNSFLYELLVVALLTYIVAHLTHTKKSVPIVRMNLWGFSLILASHAIKALIIAYYWLIGGLPFDAIMISTILLFAGFLFIIFSYLRVVLWHKKGVASK